MIHEILNQLNWIANENVIYFNPDSSLGLRYEALECNNTDIK